MTDTFPDPEVGKDYIEGLLVRFALGVSAAPVGVCVVMCVWCVYVSICVYVPHGWCAYGYMCGDVCLVCICVYAYICVHVW